MSAEVKPGFKQTEVGVLPVDWEARKLGELASFRTGPFGSALHKSDYTNDGIPVVNPMHILDGRIVPTTSMTITEDAAKNLEEFRLKPGEVIIGRRGDMGRCAVVSERERGWLCGTGSMIVRPSVSADAYFLQRVLSSPSIVKAIEDSSVGSTMINLNQGTLSNLVVQAPKVEEQRAVAATLSDIDTLISSLDQQIAKKRDIQQAAMQQLLTGQYRLPGFSGEWDMKRLGEIFSISTGKSKSPHTTPYGNYWIVDMGSVSTEGKLIVSKRTDFGADFLNSGDLVMPKDDIGGGGIIGRAGYIDADDTYVLSDHVYRLQANFGNPLFLSFAINGYKINSALRKKVIGSAQLGLSRKSVEEQEISLPSFEEQTAIATILSDMDTELADLEARRNKAQQLKQGMMQELLTGRIRLTNQGV
ncbi:restriction endonuclease subunit S [Stutzerimonas stutzeri]|uniref:restriction endonuclease subunit S n=1 Tax=Stutzerimonas stutzeri TaxID=316 RepID=UPI0021126362|nr:restriction endonuclease subunit S [Stutzerimonas stutzeri]UUC81742.1 restriction endonuclease subunit S [Stutzerimonas stutzeri]